MIVNPALPVGSPQLVKNGSVTQLVVSGKPYLMLGGELSNSASSNVAFMAPIWPKMNAINVNTVLTPVSWAQLEPKEGTFDYSLIDGLIDGARSHHIKIVVLWLASWKNGMSCYMPLWVKKDYVRFPRIHRADGKPIEVLSTLSDNNWKADSAAFTQLMSHIRQYDSKDHTVLMVQVENEVGVLGDSRDRSDDANAAFAGPVPQQIMDLLTSHSPEVVPEMNDLWVAAGSKSSGSWTDIFGSGLITDELFMAWNYSRYADHVAAAGKAVYPIPMYCNCWLNNPTDKPGNFPSGCPESNMMTVWKAGAPHIDLLAPDLYASNFKERCDLYTRIGNILFIPEMGTSDDGARNIYYAVGAKNALGTSPFGIDHAPADSPIGDTYKLLNEVSPIILSKQTTGDIVGFSLTTDNPSVTYDMNGYELTISLLSVFGHVFTQGAGLVIAYGPDQFIGVGSGFQVAFKPLTTGPTYAGVGEVETGSFRNGDWVTGRVLNGDDEDQGWHWQMSRWSGGLAKCLVYRYQ